jgi:hypothetical protein
MRHLGFWILDFGLALAFMLAPDVHAQALPRDEAAHVFVQANERYQAGTKLLAGKKPQEALKAFGEAAALYEKIVGSGFRNGQVHYNLGCAYYRQGKRGLALASFRRAERFLPRNADLKANLTQVKSELEDREDRWQAPEILRSLLFWHFSLTLNEATLGALALYGLLAAALVLFIFVRANWLRNLSLLLAACLVCVVASLALRVYDQHARRGVVVAKEAEVRYGPGAEYEPKFKVHEGAEFAVEEERENWYKVLAFVQVKAASGSEAAPETDQKEMKRGWIRKTDGQMVNG